SALTSFIIGVLLALVCQNLDVAVRSMDQVRSLLKVHPLGMVPALGGIRRPGNKPESEVLDRPLSAYAEAIRSIHTNLMLSDVDTRPPAVHRLAGVAAPWPHRVVAEPQCSRRSDLLDRSWRGRCHSRRRPAA